MGCSCVDVASPVCLTSTVRGPTTESTALLAMLKPSPEAIPCITEPRKPSPEREVAGGAAAVLVAGGAEGLELKSPPREPPLGELDLDEERLPIEIEQIPTVY